MRRRPLVAIGSLGIAAVALYVGATLLGSALDSNYSQIGNAISELTGPDAPNRTLMASIYMAYNLLQLGFGYALLRASSGGTLFQAAAVLFAIAAVSGIGQVTVFRMDTVGTPATTAGTMHLVLASVSSLLTVAIAVLYGVAFRREPTFRRLSTYSFATAGLLVLTAPAAVASIGTDVMGLFERITIGVFMVWLVVVAAYSLMGARIPAGAGSATASA